MVTRAIFVIESRISVDCLREFICVFVFMSINRICAHDGVWLVKRLRNPAVAKCQTKAVEQINKLNERLLHVIR